MRYKKGKKDKVTFLVKMDGKYIPCSITLSLTAQGIYRLNYEPLISTCLDFNTNKITDIVNIKSMYGKDTRYNLFADSLVSKNTKGDDYAMFFDNDAEENHETSGIGWNYMMFDCVGEICKITGNFDNDHTSVTRDGYSWTMHNSCLRYVNIDLLLVV